MDQNEPYTIMLIHTLFSWIEKQRLQNHEHYTIRNQMLDELVEEIHKLNEGRTTDV